MPIKKNLLYFGDQSLFNLLQYFRLNDPYRLVVILVLLVLMAIPVFLFAPAMTYPELDSILIGEKIREGFSLYSGIMDSTGFLAGWFFALCHFLFDDSLVARHIFGFLLLFFQAALIGFIFIDKKVFQDSTYVPPLIFAVLAMFSFDTFSLTADIAGSFFLLFALNNLFKELEFKEQRTEYVFNTGLWIGVSSLFVFSFAVYLIAALVILGLYSRITGPKFLLVIVGFMLPHLLLFAWYNLHDEAADLWNFFYLPNLQSNHNSFATWGSLLTLMAVPGAFLIMSIVILNRESRFTKYQAQLVQAMFFWMIFSLLQIWYTKDLRPQSLITLFPVLTFYISHLLLMIRRRKFSEIGFWIFLGGIVVMSALARYDKVARTVNDSIFVAKKEATGKARKILVLGPDKGFYLNNSLATPFLDWSLASSLFDTPEYYESQLAVYKGFSNDLPDLIIDPGNKMAPFLKRAPTLNKKYKRTNTGYEKISN